MILLSPAAGVAQATTTPTSPDPDASALSAELPAPAKAARRAEATRAARRSGDAITGDPAEPPPQRSGDTVS